MLQAIFHLLGSFSATFWLLAFVSSLPFIYWYSIRNQDFWKKRGIPGPPPVPFFGNFCSIFTPQPMLYQEYLKKYGTLFGVYQGTKPILVVTEPEIVKRMWIRDFHIFRNRPESPSRHRIFGQNLVAARDSAWKRQRSILNPMFSNLKLKKLEDMMTACVGSMLEAFDKMAASKQSFEARDPMGNFTIDIIAKCAFATDTNAHSDKENPFVKAAKNFFAFRMIRFLGMMTVPRAIQRFLVDHEIKPFFIEEYAFFEKLSCQLIKDRKASKDKHNDILNLMINAELSDNKEDRTAADDEMQLQGKEGQNAEEMEVQNREFRDIIGSKYLSEEEVMAQAMVFFLAGYETTANTLAYTMYELAVHPEVQERLYQEIQQAKKVDPALTFATLAKLPYMDAIIAEVLRQYAPALSVNRECSEDYYIPEYKLTIPKGTTVHTPIYNIHHQEEYYPEPFKFNPERFMGENREKIPEYTYLPFGGGPRICIGMKFSMAEAKLGLSRMLDRFRVIRTPETEVPLQIKAGMFLLKTSPIMIAVERRNTP